ncbi:MAG: hypothetical protein HC934_07065 [Acaryochloridaceae cyanobacterium SU_2_1]|nr:hypothetical protein [Acaryochloridaceae cyanobacterium SU_2_1]
MSHLSHLEQIRLIMTHPFFTGQCPECKAKIPIIARSMGSCECPTCGWSDQPEAVMTASCSSQEIDHSATIVSNRPILE